MYLNNLGEIIATRRLINLEASDKEILVLLGKPKPSEDSLGYYCAFQILGIGEEKIKYAKGVDAIQAVQSAMLLIGTNLEFLNQQLGGKLRWEGATEGDLGFPSSTYSGPCS